MREVRQTGSLDLFRLIAALLVITVHTSPLAVFSAEADFFLARILARTAVPFFLMTTGYFVLSDSGSVKRSLKKTAVLYAVSSAIYLPVGIYAGLYRGLNVFSVFRILFFDGTFYHLWYFPACMMGLVLVALLRRFLSDRGMMAAVCALYLVGLFGDSYYGLVVGVPGLSSVYSVMFSVFSYTRNGLFISPVFLLLGLWFRRGKISLRPAVCAAGFALSLCAMTAEGFLLRYFQLQRHDSMYVFLIPCAVFLYGFLLSRKKAPSKVFRTVSSWVYVLHPACIILFRGMVKVLKVPEFAENNLLVFLAASVFSFASASGIAFLSGRFIKPSPCGRAWIEIDRAALKQNVKILQTLLPENCVLMPAVKANAYGHGAVPVAKELNRLGIFSFCVACCSEGVELRRAGVKGEILILGYTHPDDFPLLRRYRLTQTVVDYPYASLLNRFGKKIRVHVGVDTGMRRLGERADRPGKICRIFRMKNLSVGGIFTHFCDEDSDTPESRAFTQEQADEFYRVVRILSQRGIDPGKKHLLSSYGLLRCPRYAENAVRVGIALYGLWSTEDDARACRLPLLPVLSLKARIASVRELLPRESVGYGRAYVSDRERRIAVIAAGYADGLPRALSCGVGSVLVCGRRAPVLGRICMDQMMVDVTGIPGVAAGETAVIIGRSGEESISASSLAAQCGTITNEIVSRLGPRLERIVT